MTKLEVFAVALIAILAAAASASATRAVASKATASGTTVSVVAGKPTEFGFTLSKKSVPRGWVTFKITNQGKLRHEFKVCASNKGGLANDCNPAALSPGIAPGASTTVKVDLKTPGTYEFLCGFRGHAAEGMKGRLKVT